MEYLSNARQRQEEQGRGFGLVFGLLLALAAVAVEMRDARAELRLEYSQGQCEQNRGGKGSWWNDHYRTHLDLNDGCHQIGFSAKLWQWRGNDIGVRFAYVNLGRIAIDSVMAFRDDEQLSNPTGENCGWAQGDYSGPVGHGAGHNCLIHVAGAGNARGVSVGMLAERQVGSAVLGVEGGAFVYYNNFKVRIDAFPDPSITPHWVWGEYWDWAKGWNATPYLGANVRYGWLTASVRTYAKVVAHSRETGQSGVTNGEAWQVNVGLSIPVTL